MSRVFLFVVFLWSNTAVWSQQISSLVGVLPDEVRESSGLVYHNGNLITHNDSGNEPLLFVLDTASLQIVRTIRIRNAVNIDWEDIAQDDTHFYIGDIGNNAGDRQELQVYKISKTDADLADAVDAELIRVSYEDGASGFPGPNSDWDAEALLVFEEELFIFTKQWQSNGTKAYAFPKEPGTYSARLRGTYASNGLITGAVYNEYSAIAYLSGYTQLLQPFLIRLENFSSMDPFGGTVVRQTLDIALAQLEGIGRLSANRYYLSSEAFQNISPPISLQPSLFSFQTSDIEIAEPPPAEEPPPGEEPPDTSTSEGEDLLIYGLRGSKLLEYELYRDEPVYGRAIFDLQGRRVQFTHSKDFQGTSIDLSTLGSAVYFLTFYLQGKTISKPFFIN